jgi:hypothetical protein
MPEKKYNLYFLEGYPALATSGPLLMESIRYNIRNLFFSLKKTWEERLKIINAQNSVVEEARESGLKLKKCLKIYGEKK